MGLKLDDARAAHLPLKICMECSAPDASGSYVVTKSREKRLVMGRARLREGRSEVRVRPRRAVYARRTLY